MIDLKVHSVLDYVAAAILLVCPFLFGFSDIENARNLFLTLGIFVAAYSLVTRYRYSVLKIIPVGPHMFLDILTGFVLMIGPYSFGYRALITSGQTALHFVVGLGLWALVGVTRQKRSAVGTTISDMEDFRRAA